MSESTNINGSIRRSNSPEEIQSVLLQALAQERVFTVWQRDAQGVLAFNIEARLDSLDEGGNFQFRILGEIPAISKGMVFFALNDSSIVFKTPKVQLEGLRITVTTLPEEAKYKERRKHKRKRYKPKDHKDIELIFESNDQDEPPLVIKSRVIDLSDSGACLMVSKNTLSKIDTDVEFKIKSLSDLNFTYKSARIKNARRFKGRNLNQEELYLVGVIFC